MEDLTACEGHVRAEMTPLSTIGVLRRTWFICRAHFSKLASLSILPWLCVAWLSVYVDLLVREIVGYVYSPGTHEMAASLFLLIPLLCWVPLIFFLVGQGVLIYAVTRICVGQEVRFGHAYWFSLRRLGRIIPEAFAFAFIPFLVAYAVAWLVPFMIALSDLLASAEPPGPVRLKEVIWLLFALIYGYVLIKVALFDKVLFLEKEKGSSAPMKRSRQLVRGKADGVWNSWRVFVLGSIGSGIVLAASLLARTTFQAVSLWIQLQKAQFDAEWLLSFVTMFGGLVGTLFCSVGLIVLYLDIRFRTEGLDPKSIVEKT
ncbi:MAG: hypothetical protein AB1646_18050 [Thermodesulfobacteriota bacterium]